jgi:hypothetical protein
MFGSLVPFLTNPFTIAAIGAAVGGYILWRHFRHGTEKRLRDAIKSEYGIDVKDMQVLQQVKAIGEQTFGKGQVGKHLLETIKLGPVRDLLAQYAESTGQQSSKLVTDAQYADPGYSGNRFVRGGENALGGNGETGKWGSGAGKGGTGRIGEGETGGAVAPVHAAYMGALQMVAEAVDNLQRKINAARPGDVFERAIDERPDLGGKAVNKAADVSSGELQAALKKLGFK